MSDRSPISTSADWDALIASLASEPKAAALGASPGGPARGVLAAPVAIARWLVQCDSRLATRDSLSLLVIGAEKLDAVDGGRWYQLLPALLGRALSIDVTLVGDRLNVQFDSPLVADAPAKPARMHVGRLASYLEIEQAPAVDFAFLFHPGFQKHRGWLEDGSLAQLAACAVPVIAVSYEADECEIERWVVGCHGFASVEAPVLNPFYVDFSDGTSKVHWGRALWQFWPAPAAAGQAVDVERLAALDRLGEMVLHSIELKQPVMGSYGTALVARASDGATRRLVYIFDEYFLDPEDHSLLMLQSGVLRTIGTLSAAEVAAFPASESELARAVWAADIKSRHLLQRYERSIDAASLRRAARNMHAELEDKVERLFGQP